MSDSALQLTKRELRQLFFAPRFWAIAIAVALVIGIAGPFGTFESLEVLPRLAYWFAITVATFFIATGFTGYLTRLFGKGREVEPMKATAAGLVAGLPITLFVALVNSALFPGKTPAGHEFLDLVFYVCPIVAVVSYVYALFMHGGNGVDVPVKSQADVLRPALLDRLTADKRGRLSHLTMQDHYVEVTTDRGSTLVLMRMADAIRETDGIKGLQIHRSHWVAQDAVAAMTKQDGRLFVEMQDGSRLPVSRSRIEAVRAAGLR